MVRYAYGGLPIFIADRGFSSYNVFAHAIENKVDFLIRAKDLNVQRFLGVETLPDKLDTTVELILTRTQSKKKHKHSEKASQYRFIYKNTTFDYLIPADIYDEYPLKLRIVRFEVADGVFERSLFLFYHILFTIATHSTNGSAHETQCLSTKLRKIKRVATNT